MSLHGPKPRAPPKVTWKPARNLATSENLQGNSPSHPYSRKNQAFVTKQEHMVMLSLPRPVQGAKPRTKTRYNVTWTSTRQAYAMTSNLCKHQPRKRMSNTHVQHHAIKFEWRQQEALKHNERIVSLFCNFYERLRFLWGHGGSSHHLGCTSQGHKPC